MIEKEVIDNYTINDMCWKAAKALVKSCVVHDFCTYICIDGAIFFDFDAAMRHTRDYLLGIQNYNKGITSVEGTMNAMNFFGWFRNDAEED